MQNFLKSFHSSLAECYSKAEINAMAMLLLEHITGLPRIRLLADKTLVFSDDQRKKGECCLQRLLNYEPIQYIIGETEFYGLSFYVDSSTLIPRPETEELVEWIIKDATAGLRTQRLIDIGVGSGCIAVSLKKHLPAAHVTAIDISEQALAVASRNARRHNVAIDFFRGDALRLAEADEWGNGDYDVIVSNPPYIPQQEAVQLDAHVVSYEPALALFVPDDDPLIFYRSIAEWSLKQLAPGGRLYFETHKDFAVDVKQLLVKYGFNSVELRNDMSDNGRMVRAEYSGAERHKTA